LRSNAGCLSGVRLRNARRGSVRVYEEPPIVTLAGELFLVRVAEDGQALGEVEQVAEKLFS